MKLKLTESELRAVIKSLKEIKRLSVIEEKNYREREKEERKKYDKAMFKKDITKRDGYGNQEDKEIYDPFSMRTRGGQRPYRVTVDGHKVGRSYGDNVSKFVDKMLLRGARADIAPEDIDKAMKAMDSLQGANMAFPKQFESLAQAYNQDGGAFLRRLGVRNIDDLKGHFADSLMGEKLKLIFFKKNSFLSFIKGSVSDDFQIGVFKQGEDVVYPIAYKRGHDYYFGRAASSTSVSDPGFNFVPNIPEASSFERKLKSVGSAQSFAGSREHEYMTRVRPRFFDPSADISVSIDKRSEGEGLVFDGTPVIIENLVDFYSDRGYRMVLIRKNIARKTGGAQITVTPYNSVAYPNFDSAQTGALTVTLQRLALYALLKSISDVLEDKIAELMENEEIMRKKDVMTTFGLHQHVIKPVEDPRDMQPFNFLRKILYFPSLIMFRASGGGRNVRKYRRLVRELGAILNDSGIKITYKQDGEIGKVDLKSMTPEQVLGYLSNAKQISKTDLGKIMGQNRSEVSADLTINKTPNLPN